MRVALIDEAKKQVAAAIADVPPGGVRPVELEGRSILLCNSKDQLFAVVNRCSHADAPATASRRCAPTPGRS